MYLHNLVWAKHNLWYIIFILSVLILTPWYEI